MRQNPQQDGSPKPQQRVGMNHAAFGACELGRQLRKKKLRELQKSSNDVQQSTSFSSMKKRYSKQRPLFMEMLKTERLYVDSLHVVVSRFMLPLQVALETFPVPILDKKSMDTIFGNIAQLFEVNLELLRIIESNLDEHHTENTDDSDLASAFAKAFTNMLPVFKAFYSVYANNYETSIDVMEECRERNPMFRKLLSMASQHEECQGLDLGDFLIKPVQRICKYPLFFRGLLECTDESHPMHSKIQAASVAVSRIANQVNQTGKEAQNGMRSFEIASQLDGLSKLDPDLQVVAPGRKLIHEFQCKVHYSFQTPGAKPTKEMRHAPYKKKPREAFLFTDVLLIAKSIGERLEFRFWLELENIMVTIPPSHSMGGQIETDSSGDHTFSAAQKRLPLDIVRIRIKAVDKNKPKARFDKATFEKPGAAATADENSFSSNESSNPDESFSSVIPQGPEPPEKPQLRAQHSRRGSSITQMFSSNADTTGPLVEKYTLWFKSSKERTRVFQKIVTLQADLEKRTRERESQINLHKSTYRDTETAEAKKVALRGLVQHVRSQTHTGASTGNWPPEEAKIDAAARTA